jgi:hypothetical protein
MYGIVLARYKKFPEVKTKGMGSIGELVAFTSEEVFHFKSQMFVLILQKLFFYRVIILWPKQLIGLAWVLTILSLSPLTVLEK